MQRPVEVITSLTELIERPELLSDFKIIIFMLDYLTNVFIKAFIFLYSTTEPLPNGPGWGVGVGVLAREEEQEEQEEQEEEEEGGGGKEKRSFIICCNFALFFF